MILSKHRENGLLPGILAVVLPSTWLLNCQCAFDDDAFDDSLDDHALDKDALKRVRDDSLNDGLDDVRRANVFCVWRMR